MSNATAAMVPAGRPVPGPLSRLRTLRRGDLAGNGPALREILVGITDPLDLEAAGAMLQGDADRARLSEMEGVRPQRIAVLGSSTLDVLPAMLNAVLLRDGILADFTTTAFNQWRFEIISGAPTLRPASPRIVVCLLDDEVIFEAVESTIAIASIEARCDAFAAELDAWVCRCREMVGGRIVLSTLPLRPLRSDRLIDYRTKARLSAAWSRMNAEILALAARHHELIVLDAALLGSRVITVFANDRMRLAAGHVYSPEFLQLYAEEIARIARADLGLAKKGLVLDLDNTLWGGVVGDVGTVGLAIGRAWPGAPYRELQELARDYAAQGVILTVCSKNDDCVAREAFRGNPEMVLREEDIAVFTANWKPKAENLRAQAAALNIGRDTLVFLDDHPVERDAMRNLLPEVQTVEVPADGSSYASLLAASGAFNLLDLSEEDRTRKALYRAHSLRSEAEANLSLDDYLRGLESVLRIEPIRPLNAVRIVQLFAKTNQFNLTGRRLSEDELRAPGVTVHAARLTDRFGDNGLIAAIATKELASNEVEIANIVVSCRVFSRGVETSLVSVMLADARRRGACAVRGIYVPSPKNRRCADFLCSLGFEPDGDGFRHNLEQIAPIPDWIAVIEDTGEQHVA